MFLSLTQIRTEKTIFYAYNTEEGKLKVWSYDSLGNNIRRDVFPEIDFHQFIATHVPPIALSDNTDHCLELLQELIITLKRELRTTSSFPVITCKSCSSQGARILPMPVERALQQPIDEKNETEAFSSFTLAFQYTNKPEAYQMFAEAMEKWAARGDEIVQRKAQLAYLYLATYYLKGEKSKEAYQALSRALFLDPSLQKALSVLSYLSNSTALDKFIFDVTSALSQEEDEPADIFMKLETAVTDVEKLLTSSDVRQEKSVVDTFRALKITSDTLVRVKSLLYACGWIIDFTQVTPTPSLYGPQEKCNQLLALLGQKEVTTSTLSLPVRDALPEGVENLAKRATGLIVKYDEALSTLLSLFSPENHLVWDLILPLQTLHDRKNDHLEFSLAGASLLAFDPTKAWTLYSEILTTFPNSWEAYNSLASLYTDSSDKIALLLRGCCQAIGAKDFTQAKLFYETALSIQGAKQFNCFVHDLLFVELLAKQNCKELMVERLKILATTYSEDSFFEKKVAGIKAEGEKRKFKANLIREAIHLQKLLLRYNTHAIEEYRTIKNLHNALQINDPSLPRERVALWSLRYLGALLREEHWEEATTAAAELLITWNALSVSPFKERYLYQYSVTLGQFYEHLGVKKIKECVKMYFQAALSATVKEDGDALATSLEILERLDCDSQQLSLEQKMGLILIKKQKIEPIKKSAEKTTLETTLKRLTELGCTVKCNKGNCISAPEKGFTKEALATFLEILGEIKSLEALDLSNCNLGDQGVIRIMELIHKQTLLTSLNLSGNSIGAEGLATILKNFPLLEELDLSKNAIYEAASIVLGEGLKDRVSLRILNLQGNPLSDISMHAIAKGIGSLSSLETLLLDNVTLGDKGGVALGESLKNISSLKKLVFILAKNEMTDPTVQLLAEGIKGQPSLTYLHLQGAGIKGTGLAALADALNNRSCLQTLILKDVIFDAETMKKWAEALQKQRSLSTLNLVNCNIENDSLVALAVFLEGQSALKELDLRCNRYIEAVALGEALKHHYSLEVLRLSSYFDGNRFVLADALKNHRSLREIDFSNITGFGEKMVEVLGNCSSLQHLNLEECCISESGVRALLLGSNPHAQLKSLNLSGTGDASRSRKYYSYSLSSETENALQKKFPFVIL